MPAPAAGAPYGFLAWQGLVLAWLVWAPFEPRTGEVIIQWWPRTALDIAGNLALLIPLTLALATGGLGRRQALWLGIAAAVGLEAGQVWVLGRVVSPADVALNGVGAWAALALLPAARRRIGDARRLLLLAGAGVALATVALVASAFVAASFLLAPADWDASFEIVAGDEAGGGRAYLGTVTRPRICGGEGADVSCVGPGAGARARSALVERVEASGVLRLEATVRSASDRQTGPTRIVTFSAGTGDRNATLAQHGSALLLRIRSPRAGDNGADLEYELPRAVPLDRPVRVAAGQRGGTVWLRAGDRRTAFRPAPLDAWLLLQPIERLRPGKLERAALLGALVLFVPLGWLARAGLRRVSTASCLAGAALAGAATLAAWSLLAGSGLRPSRVVLAACAAAVGVVLAVADRRRSTPASRATASRVV